MRTDRHERLPSCFLCAPWPCLWRLHRLHARLPDVVMVPAHDERAFLEVRRLSSP